MADFYAACTGGQFETVTTLSGQLVRCTGALDNVSEADLVDLIATADVVQSLQELAFMPTPEEVLYLYSWGFGAVLLPWSLALAIDAAKRVIAKA